MALFGYSNNPQFAGSVNDTGLWGVPYVGGGDVDMRGLIASGRETQRPAHDAPAALAGYSPTAMTSVPMTSLGGNPLGAMKDFQRNYQDMLDAGWKGGDKYFHCKANCEATQRGPLGHWTAEKMSNFREAYQQRLQGESRKDAIEDQRANQLGRNGAQLYPERSCRQVCRPVRPRGLPGEY